MLSGHNLQYCNYNAKKIRKLIAKFAEVKQRYLESNSYHYSNSRFNKMLFFLYICTIDFF